MATPGDQDKAAPRTGATESGFVSGGMGMQFLAFGLAAGVLVAHSAVGFLEDSVGLILSVFRSALLVMLILGVLVFALRKMLLKRLFGNAALAPDQILPPLPPQTGFAITRSRGQISVAPH